MMQRRTLISQRTLAKDDIKITLEKVSKNNIFDITVECDTSQRDMFLIASCRVSFLCLIGDKVQWKNNKFGITQAVYGVDNLEEDGLYLTSLKENLIQDLRDNMNDILKDNVVKIQEDDLKVYDYPFIAISKIPIEYVVE